MRFSRSNAAMTAAGPILFGVAFLAPLIAQSIEALGLPGPFGWAPIHVGLGLGLTLGATAALRGRWI